ncbi:MAG: hypothetical protein JO092_04235 [Candidatus Eremiobacteraeota bacterium]|nr:hypothetical protein [Candidatus Eremiobacteraeota bacterium]
MNKHEARTAAGVLGHGDASRTLRMYAHLIEGEKAKVAATVGDVIRAAQARLAADQK